MPLFGKRKNKDAKPAEKKAEKASPAEKAPQAPQAPAAPKSKKTVMFCCGTAIATSTVVALSVQEMLKERGIEIETRQCKAAEVAYKTNGIDLIVSTTPITSDIGDIPVVVTIAFLTGIGKDTALEEIASHLE